ncbi:MAG: hypothetical protein R2867_16105 [Caldilineaceae bacterium]
MGGRFALLPEVAPGVRRMRYLLHCQSADGQRHFMLYGFKQVAYQNKRRRLWALWQDTTTLYVTIYEHSADVHIAQIYTPQIYTPQIYITQMYNPTTA